MSSHVSSTKKTMNKPENDEIQIDTQLQQLQELKSIGLLAGSIVHRFNNAVGIIRGYADLALMSPTSTDRAHDYLKQIIDGTDFARDLAQGMMVFTQQKEPNFELIKIHSVVEETIKTFKDSLNLSSGPRIQIDFEVSSVTLLADADQIQQIVVNLANNAYDALRENGGILKIILKEVKVGVSLASKYVRLKEGKYAKLTVSDTGHGMDRETLKQMFKPFYTTKRISENAGLGLSIVDVIVKCYQGEIVVESNVDEGTTLDIYLPLISEENKKEE